MHTDVGGTDEIVDAVSAKRIPIGIYTYVRLCDLLCVCLPLPSNHSFYMQNCWLLDGWR